MKMFKYIGNVVHIILGVIVAFCFINGDWLISILLTVAFTVYQIIDWLNGEKLSETLTDMQEFIIGFVTGLITFYFLRYLQLQLFLT